MDLEIIRTFDAPRELVFRAWTEGEHLKVWSCPSLFTLISAENDARPGGQFRCRMRSPQGDDHVVHGVYREVTPPRRLVFTHAWEGDAAHHPETLVSVDLHEEGGKTKMIFRQTGFSSIESRDGHQAGWGEAFDNLAAHLGRSQD
jgi:uncharacterized protein YndB with AHSA1/START domain